MAYIGKIPATGNFVKLDAISVVNGQAGYTMQSSSVNFTPESANHMLVSLNGVIQAPITSFTVSGSTITFSSNLVTGDSIDFIMVYGNVLDIGTPSDDTVSSSKLKTDSVIEAKIQNDAVTRDKINAISTSSLPSFEAKGDGSSQDGYLQLNCSQNSHGIKLKSPPHSANASYTLTFPNNDGNADQVLTTNGSGVLSFADAGGGAMALLHTATGSNVSSIDINGYFASDYDHYKLIYSLYGATGNTDTMCRIMQSGSVVTASNYWYAGMGMYRSNSSTAENSDGASGAGQWRISSSDNTASVQYPTTGEMILFNPLSTTQNTTMTTTNLGYNSGSPPDAIRIWTFGGQYISTSATSGISFHYDGGNINGTIRLYGVKNS